MKSINSSGNGLQEISLSWVADARPHRSMRAKRALFSLLVGTAMFGCSNGVEAQTGEAAGADQTISGVDSKGQNWSISISSDADTSDLPMTSTMKLLGGDLPAYIQRECAPIWRMKSCDVYVQSDRTGALLGYLFISGSADEGFGFNTDTVTDRNRECSLGGSLENIEGDPRGAFKARVPFTTITDGEEAMGMIYLERVQDRLRVSDERWNYCYDDRHIDDVYTFVGSLERELDPTKWTM